MFCTTMRVVDVTTTHEGVEVGKAAWTVPCNQMIYEVGYLSCKTCRTGSELEGNRLATEAEIAKAKANGGTYREEIS